MKKITLEDWEKKYIVGLIERFDQKYMMLARPIWDSSVKIEGYKPDFEHDREIKDTLGSSIMEEALLCGGWQGLKLELLDTSKPNTPLVAYRIAEEIEKWGGIYIPSPLPKEGLMLDVKDPAKITRILKKIATHFGADLVGICKLDRRWVYSKAVLSPFVGPGPGPISTETISKPQEIPEEFQYAIAMGFEMDYYMVRYYHTRLAQAAVTLAYSRMEFTSLLLAGFIRALGYKAIISAANMVACSVPIAMQAGLGDVGRAGWLITPQFGPRVRLTAVFTDLPLSPDSPIDFGVTDFCQVCKKCANVCPSQAITYGDRTSENTSLSNVSGIFKWSVDTEKCFKHWLRVKGDCSYCISACPYNKIYTWPHRTVRWFTDHIRGLDSTYVKMDDLLGYGKARNARNFWEEWQPYGYGRSSASR